MRLKTWFSALDIGAKILLVAAAAIVAVPLMFSVASIPMFALAGALGIGQISAPQTAPLTLTDSASAASPAPSVAVTTTEDVTESSVLPFGAMSVDDPNLALGASVVTTPGTPGTVERTYRVTYVDGVETSRDLLSETITVAAIDEVTSIGTYVAPPPPPPVENNCDSNYADACVPIASDVDCAGGSGNGPAYVDGIVRVVGSDVYDLDRDGDGYGCD